MKLARTVLAFLAAVAVTGPSPAARAPFSVVQRIPGGDGGWDLLSIDSATHKLLVARTGGVMAVDLASGQITQTFVPGNRMHGVVLIPGSNVGVATSGADNVAIIFDRSTGVVRARVPTGANPDAEIYDSKTQILWVMNARDGSATLIDPLVQRVVDTVPIGGSLEMAALDGRGHLFVNVEDRADIAEIDVAQRKLVRRIPLQGCEGPTGLVLVGHGVLISACANGVAKLVSASSGADLGSIVIGPRPDGAFADSVRHRAYIPSGGDGTLAIFDTSGTLPRLLARVATQTGARTGAVDPATGRVYLPAAHFASPATPGERPKMVSGSFEILVLAAHR